MNYTYFGFFITGFLLVTLYHFGAYTHLFISLFFIGFYIIVVKSGKYKSLEKFIDDAF